MAGESRRDLESNAVVNSARECARARSEEGAAATAGQAVYAWQCVLEKPKQARAQPRRQGKMAVRTKTTQLHQRVRSSTCVRASLHLNKPFFQERKEDVYLPVVLSFSGNWRGFRFLSGEVAAVGQHGRVAVFRLCGERQDNTVTSDSASPQHQHADRRVGGRGASLQRPPTNQCTEREAFASVCHDGTGSRPQCHSSLIPEAPTHTHARHAHTHRSEHTPHPNILLTRLLNT